MTAAELDQAIAEGKTVAQVLTMLGDEAEGKATQFRSQARLSGGSRRTALFQMADRQSLRAEAFFTAAGVAKIVEGSRK